jgi:hypothetical protein
MPPLEHIERLFHQALLIDGVPERGRWLAEVCGDDAALLAEVESLLAAHETMVSQSGPDAIPEGPAIPHE